MRLTLPIGFSLVLLCSGAAAQAQEPSAGLRQADADYRAGVAALNQNDLKTAQAKFESVIRLAPALEQGHSALGAVLVREGQWTAGTHELERALAIKPSDGAAQMNLAMVYAQTGAHAKAVPLFARLEAAAKTEQHPLGTPVLQQYARSLQDTGQTQAAIAHMKQAVMQESRNADLHDELGSLYALDKDWPLAQAQFEEALRLKDDFAAAHLHLGLTLAAEQKAGAEDELSKAYTLAPDEQGMALNVGKAMSEAGNDAAAVPILEHAVQLAPQSSAARYQLALVLQRVDRIPDAISLLKQVADVEPRNSEALANLGMAYAQEHKATEGIPFLKKSIALDPKQATAHQDLAAAYIQINQIDDAIAELRIAIALSPDSPQLHYDLGTAYKLQDDATDAIPELEKAEKLNPSGYEPAYVLGLLYMQVARYAEAAKQLEASLKLHSQNEEGWATLGSVYTKLDRLPEAAKALQEAIKQSPEKSDSHLMLAAVLVKQGDAGGAAAQRKMAADLMRQHMNLQRAQVATNSGKALLQSGKLDDAVVQFKDALTFDPAYIEAHLGLAEALEKQGKMAEAAAERSQADALSKAAQ